MKKQIKDLFCVVERIVSWFYLTMLYDWLIDWLIDEVGRLWEVVVAYFKVVLAFTWRYREE
jgi:hypothetical protein